MSQPVDDKVCVSESIHQPTSFNKQTKLHRHFNGYKASVHQHLYSNVEFENHNQIMFKNFHALSHVELIELTAIILLE